MFRSPAARFPFETLEPAIDFLLTGGAGVLTDDAASDFTNILLNTVDFRFDPLQKKENTQNQERRSQFHQFDKLHEITPFPRGAFFSNGSREKTLYYSTHCIFPDRAFFVPGPGAARNDIPSPRKNRHEKRP